MDVTSGKEISSFKDDSPLDYLIFAFSPNGQLLAVIGSFDGVIKIWEVSTGKEIYTINAHPKWIEFLGFSPDGQILVGRGRGDGKTPSIKLWDVSTGENIRSISYGKEFYHDNFINITAFSREHLILASSNRGNVLKLWYISSRWWQQVKTQTIYFPTLEPFGVHFSSLTYIPDRQILVSSDYSTIEGIDNKTIKQWYLGSSWLPWKIAKEVRTLFNDSIRIGSISFSPNGRILAGGVADGNHGITLWDVENGREIGSIIGHTAFVENVAVSPDAEIIASSGDCSNIIKLWHTASGKLISHN